VRWRNGSRAIGMNRLLSYRPICESTNSVVKHALDLRPRIAVDENGPPLSNQVLQSVRRQSQRGGFRRLRVAPRIFFQFALEYPVDAFPGNRQVGFPVWLSELNNQRVKPDQWAILRLCLAFGHELPSG